MSEDLIRRSDAIKAIASLHILADEEKIFKVYADNPHSMTTDFEETLIDAINAIKSIPTIEPKRGEWIPCSERLPEDIRPVLVTWKNNDPASYYQYIVGKHFIGTAHYHSGKWYWYSSVTEDLLAEYGKCETEEFDEAIEAVAWMPLPQPWKGADDE